MNPLQLDALQLRHAAVQMADLAAPPVAAQPGADPASADPASADSASADAASFSHAMLDAVREVDASQRTAETKMASVDRGSSDDLVGAMLASRRASLSFSMLTQVRNKLTSALDELLKMQL